MAELILTSRTSAEIDAQIAKILRGLGNPEPPLDLRLVRELLELDRAYYSATDDSVVRESISRLVVAGKQIIRRPSLLVDAIRKLSLRALYLPDRRRILIDRDQPVLKHRWNEGHEIGHSVIPWHQGLMGDDDLTLTAACHAKVEAEANFAAGRLLFLRERFVEEARSLPTSIASVQQLAERFGNTKTSTLWRFVEQGRPDLAVVVVITAGHPHPDRRAGGPVAALACKHFVQSSTFAKLFPTVKEQALVDTIVEYCGPQRGGMLGAAEVVLDDCNGIPHLFHFETFFNRHEALTLGVYQGLHRRIFSVRD